MHAVRLMLGAPQAAQSSRGVLSLQRGFFSHAVFKSPWWRLRSPYNPPEVPGHTSAATSPSPGFASAGVAISGPAEIPTVSAERVPAATSSMSQTKRGTKSGTDRCLDAGRAAALQENTLKEQRCDRRLSLPLVPDPSPHTSASVSDKAPVAKP